MTDKEIILRRGGIRPVARQLGHLNHTTVQGWYERNRIPTDARPALMALPELPEEQAAVLIANAAARELRRAA